MANFDEVASEIDIEEGELVWYIRSSQWSSERDWETEIIGLMRVKKAEDGEITLIDPFDLPTFTADKEELHDELKKMERDGADIELKHFGRSGFASRRTVEVCPRKKDTPYNVRTLVKKVPADGVTRYEIGESKQVLDYSIEDVESIATLFQKANENVTENRKKRFLEKFHEASKDGVFGIISEGGYEEKVIVPGGKFVELYSVRTRNTSDSRQNISHTYDVGYIDIEAARERLNEKGELPITIPKRIIKYLDGYSIEKAVRELRANGLEVSDISLKLEGVNPSVEVEDGELVWLSSETMSLARASKTDNGRIELSSVIHFPSFSADQSELISELKKNEKIELSDSGRSGFASRRTVTVKSKKKSEDYDLKTLIRYYANGDTRYAIDNNTQAPYYSLEDVELATKAVEEARESISNDRRERFVREFSEGTVDGVFGVVPEGGYEEKVIVPEGKYIELCRIRTQNTQDHRQNLTHTEDVAYIDIEMAKKRTYNGKLHINVPEDMMGRVIGSKGSNINRITQVLNERGLDIQRIILHPKSREQWQTHLEEIKQSIEAQKKIDRGEG